MNKKIFNGITEFKNVLIADEIKVWLYTLPIKDINTKHNENYIVIKELKEINNNEYIIFNENMIASFIKIEKWSKTNYLKEENRTIDVKNLTERKLLERLLLEDIILNVNKDIYEVNRKNKSINIKKPVYNKANLIVKRKIKFDINIEDNKNIIIGFDLSHEFEYVNTLDKDLKNCNVQKGDIVKDYYNNVTYEYIGLAPFTIYDKNEYMGCSIVDYYINKNQQYIVSNLNYSTRAVLVKAHNGKIFPYIPNRLKKVCHYANIDNFLIKEINKYIKLKSHDRMKLSIDITIDVLKNAKYILFNKKNMLVDNLGYKKTILEKPKFKFGNEKIHNTILCGLPQYGSYESKEIEISYFIDPDIINNEASYKLVKEFADELEVTSNNMKVNIRRINSKINFRKINTQNKDLFEQDIRNIVDNYKNPVVVIMEDNNSEKYYSLVKKIFGSKNNIPTQFISLSTLKYNDKNKNAIFLNILLGIYGKSGIQPWILSKQLSADCYVGIDVSREKKLNTAGIIQVVGKDGQILRSKTITSPQSGEKINIETIREIFHEATYSYKKAYGKPLNHIVFHRDGISREELDVLKETASNLGIKFDYVEITKNISRRIAIFNSVDEIWETEIGASFVKDNKAYVVTTKPFATMGMAKPIRIKKVYGEESIENIVMDIYKLSYMHVGSILKSRLPVTTHYADLSSIYGNRELMPSNIDSKALHFI